MDDPSGDSYIQSEVVAPAVDAQLQVEQYVRSEIQNKTLGLFTDEQLGVTRQPQEFKAPKGGTLTDERIMEMYVDLFFLWRMFTANLKTSPLRNKVPPSVRRFLLCAALNLIALVLWLWSTQVPKSRRPRPCPFCLQVSSLW